MKDFLLFIFTKLLINVKNKKLLSLLFLISAAVLSAFLTPTVTAALIAVAVGFYSLYQENKASLETDDLDMETESLKDS